MNRLLLLLVPAWLGLPAARAQAPADRVVVIRGATIVPVTGPRVAGGDLIIRGDRIEAVGAGLAVPAGAVVSEGRGLFVYPGFINSGTQLGLQEIGSVPGGTDTRELGDFNPQDLILTAVNPHSELIPVTRVNGITSAITSGGGGLISGYAALIDLAGWTPNEMAVRPRAALWVTYPRVAGGRFGGRRGAGAGTAEEVNQQVKKLRDYLQAGKDYRDRKGRVAGAGGALPAADLALDALGPALAGEVPVVFEASTASQIRGALALADSFGLKPVIAGGQEAWLLADTLAARKVPVVVGPLTSMPDEDDPYDLIYANPGVLAKAGVTIAFRTDDAADARNLPYNAALAVAYGLDPDEAIRALTINPARIWGADDRLGSLESGKIANLMLTTGDPLDVRTEVRQIFIRGEPIPMTDRHTKLYEQFRARPPRR